MQTPLAHARDASRAMLAKTSAYYLAFAALGMTSATLGPTLTGLAAQTGSAISQVSYLFTARSLGYLLGSLLGGRLYDRFRGHRVMTAALLVMAGMLALVPGLPRLAALAGAMGVLGFAEGTLDVGGNTLLPWVYGERVGPVLNGLHLCFGVGAFLAPALVALMLARAQDVAWAYWLLALALLPIAAVVARPPSPPIRSAAQSGGRAAGPAGLIALVMLFFALNVGAETSFAGWIFTYTRALNLAGEVAAAYLTSAFWGGMAAGRVLAILISSRVHPRWILLADVLGLLGSLALVATARSSFTLVLAGAVGAGLSIASVFPTTLLLAARFLPVNGRTTGLFFVGGCAGSMFFPWLIGQMFEPLGPRSAILTMLAATALSLGVYVAIARFTRSEPKTGVG